MTPDISPGKLDNARFVEGHNGDPPKIIGLDEEGNILYEKLLLPDTLPFQPIIGSSGIIYKKRTVGNNPFTATDILTE